MKCELNGIELTGYVIVFLSYNIYSPSFLRFCFGNYCSGTPRPPFDDLIQMLVSLSVVGDSAKRPPIVSIDIPSGWHVEEGDVSGGGIKPDMLVSIY